MSPACELGLALMAACVIVPPDGKPPVSVTRACIGQFSEAQQEAAKKCAAEHGVTWKIARKIKRRPS